MLHLGTRCNGPVPRRYRHVGLAAVAAMAAAALATHAGAQSDPPGCSSAISPAAIQLSALYASNNELVVTPLYPGQEIKVQLTLVHLGLGSCNYYGGQAAACFPDGTLALGGGHVGGTGDIPTVSFGNPHMMFPDETYAANPALSDQNCEQVILGAYGADICGLDQEFGFLAAGATHPQNQSASTAVIIRVADPSITITKEADPGKICEGDCVTYTYTVTGGESCPKIDAFITYNNIVVTDSHCANVVCETDTLAPGESMTCECIQCDLTEDTTNTATVTADALIDDNPGEPFSVEDSDTAFVEVNPNPVCFIEGPDLVTCGEPEEFCGPAGMATYAWSVSGDASIDGADDEECVTIIADDVDGGSYTVSLAIVDENGCEDDCEWDVEVECPTGACCIDPATSDCADGVSPEFCKDVEGTFFPGLTCEDEKVEEFCQPVGACCIDPATEDCVDGVVAAECDDLGGEFFPNLMCDDPEVVDFCSEDPGGEGCTPGFWMQPHHCGHWPCDVNDVQGSICPDGCPGGPAEGTLWTNVCSGGVCLDDVGGLFAGRTVDSIMGPPGQMGFGPSQLRILVFHTIAALLNAGNDEVAYGMSVQAVIENFNDAIAEGTASAYLAAKNVVADLNEQGCPLSGHADLHGGDAQLMEDGYVNAFDLIYVIHWWNTGNVRADVNKDGVVDIFDMLEVLRNWGPQTDNWATLE